MLSAGLCARVQEPRLEASIRGLARRLDPKAAERAWVAALERFLGGGGVYTGEEGHRQLSSARQAVESEVASVAAGRPAAEWLIVLRVIEYACPNWSVWRIGQTALSSRHRAPSSNVLSMISVDLSPDMASRLSRCFELEGVFHKLDVALRRVSKGQTVRLAASEFSWSSPLDQPSLDGAIDLFDRRRRRHPIHMGASIGSVGDIGYVPGDGPRYLAVMFNSLNAQPGVPERETRALLTEFHPWRVEVVNLQRLAPGAYESGEGDNLSVGALRALLEVCADAVVEGQGLRADGWWSRYGILQLPRDALQARITNRLVEVGFDDEGSAEAARHVFAPSSQITFRAGATSLIDLAAASSALTEAHVRPIDGAGAQMWGRAFEPRLQGQIDKSAWRPTGELRGLIGKEIWHAGRKITDIDAVAQAGQTVLLVDYKSYPSTRGTRTGEFRETRNLRDKVEEAATKWKDKTALMNVERSILGVPIESVMTVDGVVVVPEVPFVHLSPATERIAGLHRVCSINEFNAMLVK